jgi:hypothetical protein
MLIDLQRFEYQKSSQNQEDGVIEEIFFHIGVFSSYYVEFGAHDGYWASNTQHLRENGSWKGLLLDKLFHNPEINLQQEFLTAENINAIFEKYHVPKNLDFLSIDVDGNDFYLWNALSAHYRPRLIVIEYNGTHPPHEDKVITYQEDYQWDQTNYFGASLCALFHLARKKGYSLVYTESSGLNAFFVRDDLLKSEKFFFKNTNEIEKIYKTPRYGNGPNGGHPQDPFCRPYLSSTDILANS